MSRFRDSWGIPHLRAETVPELAYEQGAVTAVDRPVQLHTERLRVQGRTATELGPAGVTWDRFARRARVADTAARAYAGLTPETRNFVDAYVAGVNATLRKRESGPVEPWPNWMPLGVFLVNQILFGSFPLKLWRRQLEASVGTQVATTLAGRGDLGGSNAFVLGGGRTSSGLPIVAGDPHRMIESPGCYAQVRLACDEFDTIGFAFPGVPGVQHFGHTGSVAWGITNACADYQDVFLERLHRRGDEVLTTGPDGPEVAASWTEQIEIAGAGPAAVEIVVTDRGPVVSGEVGDAVAYSLRTPSLVTGALGFEALLPLLRAHTVADVDAAFDHWVEPVNDVVAADSAGATLHRVAGLVPVREESQRRRPVEATAGDRWRGWVEDLPRQQPIRQCLVVANSRADATYDRIGVDFAPRYRRERISELLRAVEQHDVTSAGAVLADVRQNAGAGLLACLAELSVALPAEAEELRGELAAWDRQMTAASTTAAAFVAVREHVIGSLCRGLPESLAGAADAYDSLFAPWCALPTRVSVALHRLIEDPRPLGVDRDRLLSDALTSVAANRPAAWGARHLLRPLTARTRAGLPDYDVVPLERPLAGDSDCVRATATLPGYDACVNGPVARYVWDLADRSASRWVVPLGAREQVGDPHRADQCEVWAHGETVPVVSDWRHLTEEPT